MCGICGFVGTVERPMLERMTSLLRHRGPDDFGYHYGSKVGLGCRRLSIIDVAGGHQPVYNEDGTKCVVQNGEIFNYKELMQTLQGRGHQFRSVSDTEVIIHACEEWGDGFCTHLNGDFAIAIWDEPSQTLMLARDRCGVHPLYFTEVDGSLIFSSELKSLLCHPSVSRELDPPAIDQYLTLRYVPEGRTLFRHIRKLPPASLLKFRDGKAVVTSYWKLPELEDRPVDLHEAAEELFSLLRDSVRLRMRSDVPVAAYLSGGLDSSAIVGLMTQFTKEPVKTFCVGFGTEIDEFDEARVLAGRFGTDHREIRVGPRDFELLPRIVWHLDEPIGDAIVIPTYRLAQEAGRETKVVLSGEGADELWAGYIHHLAIANAARLPRPALRMLSALVRALPAGVANALFPYPAALGQRGKQALVEFLQASDLHAQFLTLASCFRPEDKAQAYSPEFRKSVAALYERRDTEGGGIRSPLQGTQLSPLDTVMRFDMANWLPDYTLLKQDKLGFAGSLEIRVPYLDYRLVEFAFRLPERMKIAGLTNKRLLREAVTRVIPEQNARARKKAFYIPVEKVFGGAFDDYVRDILGSQRCRERGIFSPEYIQERLRQVRTTELLSNKQLVAAAVLELWFRTFVDGDGQSPVGA